MGQPSPGAVVEEHLMNHLPTPEEGWHGLKDGFPAPQKTNTRRAAQLVGRPNQKVAAQLLHIHPLMGQALAGIHQEKRA